MGCDCMTGAAATGRGCGINCGLGACGTPLMLRLPDIRGCTGIGGGARAICGGARAIWFNTGACRTGCGGTTGRAARIWAMLTTCGGGGSMFCTRVNRSAARIADSRVNRAGRAPQSSRASHARLRGCGAWTSSDVVCVCVAAAAAGCRRRGGHNQPRRDACSHDSLCARSLARRRRRHHASSANQSSPPPRPPASPPLRPPPLVSLPLSLPRRPTAPRQRCPNTASMRRQAV